MKLLDLFCGAGGAAMGYHQAGFDEIIGVDIEPQPRYPFEFVQADALEYLTKHGREFDLIHASPPCQAYSRATAWRGDRNNHPDMIATVREELICSGLPYIIENVEDARSRLQNPIMLCGTALGLPLRRHRYFEIAGSGFFLVPPCAHQLDDFAFDHGGKQTERQYADAMGCDWMTVIESREAIPPAYTKWIGQQLITALRQDA
jgi:DNA (cytosine-5)-methyltransferase 1